MPEVSGPVVTRFAPSPTGRLHLGHAYSALLAWSFARRNHGRFLLRIEDIDPERCRPELVEPILEDLAWLEIDWDGDVILQSGRMNAYAAALSMLREMGVVYPDNRTRREIETGVGVAPRRELEERIRQGEKIAWRLDLATALKKTGELRWSELAGLAPRETSGDVHADATPHGDVILARKDVPTSYHLAVTVDDAEQGVTHVIRGEDLRESTPVHRLLQTLLGLRAPLYHHHRLIHDPRTGRRFAKSDGSVTLAHLRELGVTPAQVRARVGFVD